ncbi:MAG TPA: hypothetical protein VII92_19235 [Anaerolineae bacterium]
MNPVKELNDAVDSILNHTDPDRRNLVRALLRYVIALARQIPVEVYDSIVDDGLKGKH